MNRTRPTASRRPDPRRAVAVWAAATAVYVVAILGRTSFGVAGVDAIDRFGVDASRLAVFTAVQVGVYAAAQIPAGMLIDRWGARRSLVGGALVMAAGQLVLAATAGYPAAVAARVLVGAGDAGAFLSVMRLLPTWFDMRRTPLFTQLTSALGQAGQFLSAVPFLALLHGPGWTPAFTALAAAGALVALLAWLAVRDAPGDAAAAGAAPGPGPGPRAALGAVLRHPACWQGFFTHSTGLLSMGVFTLLWGMPLMTLGQGMTPAAAGRVLVWFTAATIAAGPAVGLLSARLGARRPAAALAGGLIIAAAWTWFLAPAEPRGPAAATALAVIVAVCTPVANTGFDTVRERVDRRVLAAGTGLANMGGFLATMAAAQGIGLALDAAAPDGAYGWADFRLAFLAMAAVWAVGMIGLAVTSRADLAPRRPRPVRPAGDAGGRPG